MDAIALCFAYETQVSSYYAIAEIAEKTGIFETQNYYLAPSPAAALPPQNESEDAYDASFIHDSTPTIDSSSDSDEPRSSASVVKTMKARKRVHDNTPTVDSSSDSDGARALPATVKSKKTRKRVVFDSDDESSSEPSAPAKDEGTAAANNNGSRESNNAISKYTPLIILGAGINAVETNGNASSPEIPVITLE